MTIVEYLNKLTQAGTKCALPDELFNQHTQESSTGDGMGGKSGLTVVCYKSESISEAKRELKLLKDITMRAMNCKGDNASLSRLFIAIKYICSKQLEGDYESIKEDFKSWFLMFIDTICSEISKKMLVERNCPGARYWLTTLQTRMESWQKMVNVETSAEGNTNVTVNFGSWN